MAVYKSNRSTALPLISNLPVATAGGVRQHVVKDTLKSGADILVVRRAITASKNIRNPAEQFPEEMNREEIDQFRIMTDF